jgi:hypothetical protein
MEPGVAGKQVVFHGVADFVRNLRVRSCGSRLLKLLSGAGKTCKEIANLKERVHVREKS